MSYQPFLISNYATGFDRERQPWLLPNDAFQNLFDGYVYRGVVNKRDGYDGFATGEQGGASYCESRMVKRVTSEAYGIGNGSAGPYTHTASNTPLRRGTITVTAGAQVATDDGEGGWTGNASVGTINYTTGQMSITFNGAVGAIAITVTYDYHPGNPVMGVMNFYTSTNTRQLIVADTRYVNRYNSSTNRLDDISPASAYSGTSSNFWSWVNYPDANDNNRLLFANGNASDVIQSYDGSSVSNYAYTHASILTLNCTQLFQVQDRLVLFQTVENGTLFPRRIRISGFGANCDDFDETTPGAGVIDIPDNSWYFGAAFNRNDIIFFTENSVWLLKYTNNDVVPFVLEKLDESRGSKAAFSVITYLNRTMAASPRGLIMSDGYAVQRMDLRIPDYAIDEIDAANFNLCFAGFIDQDRDVYLIHPSPNESQSDRILVANFEEDNYSVYRLPLSCMGNYILSYDETWNDLLRFNSWDEMAAEYGNWLQFAYMEGSPVPIGGGHGGEVWKLTVSETEDNPQKIRSITYLGDNVIRVTTDYNNYSSGDPNDALDPADYIYFAGVEGMTEINGKQGAITNIATANYTFDVYIPDLTSFSAYTSGGTASRVIPMDILTKTFNPYSEDDRKVRCGWLYFYVTTTGTALTNTDDEAESCFLEVDVLTDDRGFDVAPPNTYRIDCTNLSTELGVKKWTKIWINQTAKFVQFRIRNTQAGAKVQIHAMMPGFQPTGRLI